MQKGKVYHFVQYFEEQKRKPTNTWSWTTFVNQMEKQFLLADIAKADYKELQTL